jgi:large subunit ribosomal protein L6
VKYCVPFGDKGREMSRIGLKPVEIPSGVTVTVTNDVLSVKGAKGQLSRTFHDVISFDIQPKIVNVSRSSESKEAKSLHGLYRKLLDNMVVGVSKGFQKVLIINGVGFRAEMKGKNLRLSLGFSHPIEYMVPADVTAAIEGNNKIVVSGIDREKVGQVAAEIRGLRAPEPYKGKGIKYEDETIRRKVGKSGVK